MPRKKTTRTAFAPPEPLPLPVPPQPTLTLEAVLARAKQAGVSYIEALTSDAGFVRVRLVVVLPSGEAQVEERPVKEEVDPKDGLTPSMRRELFGGA